MLRTTVPVDWVKMAIYSINRLHFPYDTFPVFSEPRRWCLNRIHSGQCIHLARSVANLINSLNCDDSYWLKGSSQSNSRVVSYNHKVFLSSTTGCEPSANFTKKLFNHSNYNLKNKFVIDNRWRYFQLLIIWFCKFVTQMRKSQSLYNI